MKFKFLVLVLSLTSISLAKGATRNLCDDLIDSGSSSAEQIKRCLEDQRFGKSDHYKEQEKKNAVKIEIEKTESAEADKNKSNLEIKKFTSEDLAEAGFGKPFYAIRGDYRNHKYKEKRITEGDALCSYLGYEKAMKSIVSGELWENKHGKVKVDKQGLVLDTNIFGMDSKTPEIYRDEDFKFTVRKYVEISCVRRKNKKLEGSTDAMKVVTEDLIMLNGELNSVTDYEEKVKIHDGARSNSNKDSKTTPNGYSKPDWAKDAEGSGK